VPDDQDSIRAALAAQAAVEVAGAAEPDPALVAAQAYLQRLAPWDVVVPYAGELAALIGRSPAAPRIKRDFARLLSLIKAHAVLCHGQRSRDASGRLVASAEDYATVYELMGDVYAQSASGASLRIREVVEAVRELRGGTAVRITAVAARLGINKMAASRRVNAALRAGYLVNNENRRGQPASLDLGDPLPPNDGLPRPEELSGNAVTASTAGSQQGVGPPGIAAEGVPHSSAVKAVTALPSEHELGEAGPSQPTPTPQPSEAACPHCSGPLQNGRVCWACEDSRCRDCGGPTGSPLRSFCPPCSQRPAA